MTLSVLMFAAARDAAGADAVDVELSPGATVGDLRAALAHGSLAALLMRAAVAVNCEYAADDVVLHDGDAVAVIPPVSGG